MHQQQYLVQPANTEENLNIQPCTKNSKMESDGSLAPPPLLLDKGAYHRRGGGGRVVLHVVTVLLCSVHLSQSCLQLLARVKCLVDQDKGEFFALRATFRLCSPRRAPSRPLGNALRIK